MPPDEDAIDQCNAKDSPWHVIPADHKWYRNLAVSTIIVQTLEGLDMRYPPPLPDADQIVIPD